MKSMKIAVVALAMFGISGCVSGIKQEVRPVKQITGNEVCITENPLVTGKFLQEFRKSIEENGYKTKLLPANSSINDCLVVSTYIAHWSWDVATYISYLKIRVYHSGQLVGDALYDARKPGNTFDKFVRAEKKIRELVSALFPVTTVSLTTSATPSAERKLTGTTSSAERKLTGAEIQELVSGVTAYGRSSQGANIMVKYAPDGTLSVSVGSSFTDKGKWELQGDKICATWNKIRNGERACFDLIHVNGDTYRVVDPHGKEFRRKFVKW